MKSIQKFYASAKNGLKGLWRKMVNIKRERRDVFDDPFIIL